MSPIEILGILSALLVLSVFIGNQYGRLRSDSFWYDFINFISAVGLIIYSIDAHATPFIITNGVWMAVSFGDLVKYFLKKKRERKGHVRT